MSRLDEASLLESRRDDREGDVRQAPVLPAPPALECCSDRPLQWGVVERRSSPRTTGNGKAFRERLLPLGRCRRHNPVESWFPCRQDPVMGPRAGVGAPAAPSRPTCSRQLRHAHHTGAPGPQTLACEWFTPGPEPLGGVWGPRSVGPDGVGEEAAREGGQRTIARAPQGRWALSPT